MAYASQGKVELYFKDGSGVGGLLYNFDIGATYLKPVHKTWLDNEVVARFKGQTVNMAIWGYASRSGNLTWNYHVAITRAEAVVNYLRFKGFPHTVFKWIEGQVDGESTRDANDETWRSAYITADRGSIPGIIAV